MSSTESLLFIRKKQNTDNSFNTYCKSLPNISSVRSIKATFSITVLLSFVMQVQRFDKLKNKGANIWLLEIWLQKCFTFLWSGLALHREQQATNSIKTAPKMLLSCICHLFPIKRVDVCLQHKHLSLSKSVHTTCLFYTS